MSELLCRVCLQEDELIVHIYEEVEEFQMDLSMLLEICGDVKVTKTDPYPKYLCQECTTDLLITAKFRKKCAEMQERLCQLTPVPETKETANEEHLERLPQTAPLSAEEDDIIVMDLNESMDYATETVVTEEVCSNAENETNNAPMLASENSANCKVHVARYDCDICGAVFVQACTLQRHIVRLHMPTTLYSCDNCKQCYTLIDKYNEHKCVLNTQHTAHAGKTVAKEQLQCGDCGKQFRAQFALDMHSRTHTGERPFLCSICSKAYKTKSSLESHMNVHTGKQKYNCSYCQKAFSDLSNMKRHVRSHTGEKPHSCTVCGKSFGRVFMLQLHMRTHTGERPYQCEQCSQRFTQLSSLRGHQRIHSGERLHECTVCLQRFLRRNQLLSHMSKKHGKLLPSADCA